MKDLLRDFLEFYRNSLLIGFFRKRGKSLVVPHLIFCIERLLELNPDQKEIKILDLGTGEGHLLRVINEVSKISGFSRKIKLYGFDFDEGMLQSAAEQNNIKAEFIKIDLRHDTLAQYYGFFDIVVAVNTLHEVYSSYIGEDNAAFPKAKIAFAKTKISDLISEIGKMLTADGTFILYDGLAPKAMEMDKRIKFTIKNPILGRYFDQAISDFSLWPISYSYDPKSKVYEMKYQDFSWFITTFKYLNTKLWPFECRQTYQYLSKEEFASAFKAAGLMCESIIYLTNDLGLWSENVSIVSEEMDFPPKSILIVSSRHYIPSKYDYFASK
jgi:SAM-dependent methyltransferase